MQIRKPVKRSCSVLRASSADVGAGHDAPHGPPLGVALGQISQPRLHLPGAVDPGQPLPALGRAMNEAPRPSKFESRQARSALISQLYRFLTVI